MGRLPRVTSAVVSAALMAGQPFSAYAQDDVDTATSLTVAVGAGIVPSYDGSDEYKPIYGAAIRGRIANVPIFSRGAALFVDVLPYDDLAGWDIGAGPAGGARLNRTGRIRDRRVRALGRLDTAWELGGWAGIAKTGVVTSDHDTLSLRVSYLADVAGAHGSYVVTPAIEYATPLSRTTFLGLSLSADYVGRGYGRYYYDVTLTGNQASGLGLYAAAGRKAGFAKLSAGTVFARSLSGDLRKGWAVFALGGYGRILGRYAQSPIVRDAGNRHQWLGGIGVAYTF